MRFPDMRDETGRLMSRGPDVRIGDASSLPWSDRTFDIVIQSTLFSSILDGEMKRSIAREMTRVLKPGGCVIWYDLRINNPRNPNVKGIGQREVRSLFPDLSIRLARVSLAPPLARILVPVSWMGALTLEKMLLFNTHYLGLLKRSTE